MAGAGGAVEGVDGSVFIGGQGEAEQVEILPLTVGMHGLGDDDRAVFDVPAQNHLAGLTSWAAAIFSMVPSPALRSAPRAIGE